MRLRILPGIAMLLALALTGCTWFNPLKDQRKDAMEDFIHALRWQRYSEAARFFTEEHRKDFLDRIDKLNKDLTITDVRLDRLDVTVEGRRILARLQMEYFMLPSVKIKTMPIEQTWVYFETEDKERNGFMITTPFPEIPGEPPRNKGTLPP